MLKTLSRRGFFGAAGGAAVAMPTVVKESVAAIGKPIPLPPMPPYVGLVDGEATCSQSVVKCPWSRDEIIDRIDDWHREIERELRYGGQNALDADLQAFKSMSPAVKRQIQHDRDFAEKLAHVTRYEGSFASAITKFLTGGK